MSWSITARVKPGDFSQLEAEKEAALSQNAECGDQFDAALQAISQLVASGAAGDSSKEFYVSAAGHSNPNHEPREGWANDGITVSINQVS